jgi:hypothetical protein
MGSLGRVGSQGPGHVHPIPSVKMVKVKDVVLDMLNPCHDIADEASVFGNLDIEGVFDGSHGTKRVNCSTAAAQPLGNSPGAAWVPPTEDRLYASERSAGTPGIGYSGVLHLSFDPEVAFDTSDRIDHDPGHGFLFLVVGLPATFAADPTTHFDVGPIPPLPTFAPKPDAPTLY